MALLIHTDNFDIEITDDGDLSLPGYDIETDIIACELGDKQSLALNIIETWEREPVDILTYYLDRDTLVKIGQKWVEEAFKALVEGGCITHRADVETWMSTRHKRAKSLSRRTRVIEDIFALAVKNLEDAPTAPRAGRSIYLVYTNLEDAMATCNTVNHAKFSRKMILDAIAVASQ